MNRNLPIIPRLFNERVPSPATYHHEDVDTPSTCDSDIDSVDDPHFEREVQRQNNSRILSRKLSCAKMIDWAIISSLLLYGISVGFHAVKDIVGSKGLIQQKTYLSSFSSDEAALYQIISSFNNFDHKHDDLDSLSGLSVGDVSYKGLLRNCLIQIAMSLKNVKTASKINIEAIRSLAHGAPQQILKILGQDQLLDKINDLIKMELIANITLSLLESTASHIESAFSVEQVEAIRKQVGLILEQARDTVVDIAVVLSGKSMDLADSAIDSVYSATEKGVEYLDIRNFVSSVVQRSLDSLHDLSHLKYYLGASWSGIESMLGRVYYSVQSQIQSKLSANSMKFIGHGSALVDDTSNQTNDKKQITDADIANLIGARISFAQERASEQQCEKVEFVESRRSNTCVLGNGSLEE